MAEAMIAEAFQIGDQRVWHVRWLHGTQPKREREASARHVERVSAVAQEAQTATVEISTADASTCHYMVVGLGLEQGSSQTEPDALALAVMDGDLSRSEARWMQGLDASEAPALNAQERVEADAQPEDSPPPVFHDCSHYMKTPTTGPRMRRSRRALMW